MYSTMFAAPTHDLKLPAIRFARPRNRALPPPPCAAFGDIIDPDIVATPSDVSSPIGGDDRRLGQRVRRHSGPSLSRPERVQHLMRSHSLAPPGRRKPVFKSQPTIGVSSRDLPDASAWPSVERPRFTWVDSTDAKSRRRLRPEDRPMLTFEAQRVLPKLPQKKRKTSRLPRPTPTHSVVVAKKPRESLRSVLLAPQTDSIPTQALASTSTMKKAEEWHRYRLDWFKPKVIREPEGVFEKHWCRAITYMEAHSRRVYFVIFMFVVLIALVLTMVLKLDPVILDI